MTKARLQKSADQSLWQKSSTVIGGLLVFALFATLLLVAWQKSTQPARRLGIGDYDGIIVDRWGDYSETNEGSRPQFRLVVQSPDGKRFTVRVDANVYESARVGMGIKNRGGQIVLIESEQRTNK
jgi:hypothetical protein